MERAAYRIIDANYNRAREALRVMEDYCRFYLNSPSMSGRAKGLRHELASAMTAVDRLKRLAHRDTPGDVGTDIRVPGQFSRQNLQDCLVAAGARLTEALRTISEAMQTLDAPAAAIVERLRYRAYTLEKDISLAGDARHRFLKIRLYVLISSSKPEEIMALTEACCKGGADCIQLRAKGLQDDLLLETATRFALFCRQAGVLSVINDRVDMAVACGADGVHLGQNDLPLNAARKLQSGPLAVGVSTHSMAQLRAAIEAGADYVGVGPVFATATKPGVVPAGLDYLREAAPVAAEAGIAAVAIGGIGLDNVEEVRKIADVPVAVCGAICNTANPLAACRQFADSLKDPEPEEGRGS